MGEELCWSVGVKAPLLSLRGLGLLAGAVVLVSCATPEAEITREVRATGDAVTASVLATNHALGVFRSLNAEAREAGGSEATAAILMKVADAAQACTVANERVLGLDKITAGQRARLKAAKSTFEGTMDEEKTGFDLLLSKAERYGGDSRVRYALADLEDQVKAVVDSSRAVTGKFDL